MAKVDKMVVEVDSETLKMLLNKIGELDRRLCELERKIKCV